MARKKALRHRRNGNPRVSGMVDSLIGKFMKMVKRGEMKATVGNLIRLLEFREELAPAKTIVRWVGR